MNVVSLNVGQLADWGRLAARGELQKKGYFLRSSLKNSESKAAEFESRLCEEADKLNYIKIHILLFV